MHHPFSVSPRARAFATLLIVASPLAVALEPGVVATRGGATVTLDDLDAYSRNIPDAQRAGFFDSPTRIENVVNQLLLQKQLAAQARASGLDKDAVVRKQVQLSEEEALGKAQMQKFNRDLKIPDFNALAQEEFIAHRENYGRPASASAKHILIAAKTRSDAEAHALAETVAKEAVASPDQFDALVEKYSDDPSKAQNHGLMPNADDPKKYVKEFAAAAGALKNPGDISPVVKTSFGYHVIRLVDRKPEQKATFEASKDAIIAKLRSEFIEKRIKTYVDELRNEPLDANPEVVASLRDRYLNNGAAAPAK